LDTDRPMSEYEAALFGAVRILGAAVLELGANESDLLGQFKEAQSLAADQGSKNKAATYAGLIKALFEPPVFYAPGDRNSN
jgi:hypothetical protein